MTLRPAPTNPMHDAQISQRLGMAAREPDRMRNALAGAAPAELKTDVAHQVYVLGLDQLREGTNLDRAVPVGWRYLLRQGDQVVAAAETIIDAGGKAAFASFNSGPYVDSTRRALGRAEAFAGAESGEDWEPRIIHVPALHAMALWLHTDADTTDVVLPLAPTPAGIEADRQYTIAEYLAALQTISFSVEALSRSDTRGS